MMTSKTGTQLTNSKNIDTSDASEFPALVSCSKKVEFRDDVSISSVSDESVCSRKSAFTQTTILAVLEDVGRTNRLRKKIADKKRRCYENFEIYKGPHTVKPKTVVIPRTTRQEVLCCRYLDDRLANAYRSIRKDTRVDVNGFEEFSNGEVWFRMEKPLKGWWIPGEAFQLGSDAKRRVCPVMRTAQPQTPVQVVTSTSTKAVSEFSFGETVDCFVNDAWRRGDVVSRQPLRVSVDGRTYRGQEIAIRKIMGKSFLCTTSIPVHSMKETRRGVTEKLDVDTEIEVVALEGVWAKIHKPCVGWIQWRKDGGQIHLRQMSVITEMVVTVGGFEDCDMRTAQPVYEFLRRTFRAHRINLVEEWYRMVEGDGERLMEIYLPAHMYALQQAHVMMNRSGIRAILLEGNRDVMKELSISVGSIDFGVIQQSV